MSTARHIKIELEIHAITCPGVWLCQNNGDVELSIAALGYTFSGKPQKPRFPLCYHEKFTMDGYFSDVNSVEELEKALNDEQINFTLWQKGRRLAYYLNRIGVILNYTGCMNNNFATIDNAIIMTKGSCFPGTISPKIEYTASIEFNTKCMQCNRIVQHGQQKRIVKNLYENGANKLNFLHQKPVCHVHAKQRHRWRHNVNIPNIQMRTEKNDGNDLCDYCYVTTDTHALTNSNGWETTQTTEKVDKTSQPNTCGHLGRGQNGESIHSEDKCAICLKYASLFDRSKEEINEP
ncbi:uncharacterized protein LOC119071280 [Bradysia coprophila]|uniref:uncharacterized protein LOC119071280 n=1 Tax=Bradysia coprophila TaxID=38358 RepID=UPI00187DA35F|nr:uncharacterized protein LOC119071280 [Bradysia coprophila]